MSLALHALVIMGVPGLKIKPLLGEIKKPKEIHLIKRALIPTVTQPPQYVSTPGQNTLAEKTESKIIMQAQPAKTTVLPDNTPSMKELQKIPAYANYYRLIRDRIRAKAYSYYDSSASGEMYLNFVLSSNGELSALSVKESSIGNEFLRQVAICSIKDAAPFPVFPAELKKYDRLQFSVSISFKND